VDATEHLLRMADEWRPRPVDLGRVDERHFVFSAGVGLDASVVKHVDEHPYRKRRFGAWFYGYTALTTFNRKYLVNPPHVRVTADGRDLRGVTVVVQNAELFTYFRHHPIRVVEPAGFDTGSISVGVLKRATVFELPTLVPRLLSGNARRVMRNRQVEALPELAAAKVEAIDDRPFPVQVDGDYIGDFSEVEFGVTPGGLLAVA
jgi:diacylglycerol kinase family enzyme